MQEGEVKLFQTNDGGDITVTNGLVEMGGGLETAAYLSLFGGATWWGNLSENETSRQYESETQTLLDSLPMTSANLLRIEDAAKRDLSWFVDEGVATSISVSASILGVKMLKLLINIDQEQFTYVENWRAK